MRLWRSQKGDISERIPPDYAVAKYLGFNKSGVDSH